MLGTTHFAKKCKISQRFEKMPDFVEISRNIVYFISTNLEQMYISIGSLIQKFIQRHHTHARSMHGT